jgi:xanthosine utilization system XapX-like protein
MSRVGQLSSFAPITIAALIGLAGVAFGDDIILPPVRVDGDATKMATQSYKFCWTAMREVNGMREDDFFAEPIS